MNAINLIFPHQLFLESELLKNDNEIYLIEEFLFFRQYAFHQQKIAFHRSSMKSYFDYLLKLGKTVHYIESGNERSDMRNFGLEIAEKSIQKVEVLDPTDNWLERRIRKVCEGITLEMHENPQFLNTKVELSTFFRPDKKSFFQTSFYKQERKKRRILMDGNEPEGGQWTYDEDNRKKYPKTKLPPPVHFPAKSTFWDEAVHYTSTHFGNNPGKISLQRLYPIDHTEAQAWLEQFLTYRFFEFGVYEDAIVKEESILNHSVLSPLINVGLILPNEVIQRSINFAKDEQIPINSLEGFVRQIIGWREFIRGMYECNGSSSRTVNFWNFDRKIPASFYTGTTGIEPIDQTIKKILETGYCHHIERLMVLGNFMLLCQFDPDEVYRWFMELFIDAYDWVMVPNIYGMSQFADGGTFATKPYIGGSNYLKKMSNYPKGAWEEVWDGLFWNFIDQHQAFFKSNPRLSMMVHSWNKMSAEKREHHLMNAEKYLEMLGDSMK